MTLTAADFPAFYEGVNGYEPFPWQGKLVKTVVEHRGRWPAVLDLPTSAGKTSALDAAVFLLALQVYEKDGQFQPIPVCERTAAVRTFFVVDRRIVVDEAGEKARRLARMLNAPPPDAAEVIRVVAKRLRAFGGGKALHVSVLRGGMYRDGSWAESPTQPTICLSTVDQVGSRLLFRGYGVSPYQRAVHAGLVGNDSLILVDEAHLSRPFIETLMAFEFYRSERWAEKDHHVTTPLQVVVMSATAGDAVNPVVDDGVDRPPKLELTPVDRTNDTLKARLEAKKIAELEVVPVTKEEDEVSRRVKFARRLADRAVELSRMIIPVPVVVENVPVKGRRKKTEVKTPAHPDATVIGVVVNRIDTAWRVCEVLRAAVRERFAVAADDPDNAVILLIGRIRPYDRDELLFRNPVPVADKLVSGWLPFMKASAHKEKPEYDRPAPPRGTLFVVATQTVEVGADLSFDALVTEAAPLDALRQRFGRLDRLGYRKESHAFILGRADAVKDKGDPVYAGAVAGAWAWLSRKEVAGKKSVDFGITALENTMRRVPPDPGEVYPPVTHAPVMMPAHIDDWAQTTIPPVPDPNPEAFLHGPNSGPPDVSVVWRADITEELLRNATAARRVVALVPPVSMEALPVPVWQARAWLLAVAERLRGAKEHGVDCPPDFTDLEGEPEPEQDRWRSARRSAPFLRWRGPDAGSKKRKQATEDRPDDVTTVSVDPDDIRPGDTIIVPSCYGGCDRFGWNPKHRDEVTDVADDCSWRAKRRPVLRVHQPSSVHRIALTAWGISPDESGESLADDLTRAARPDTEDDDPDPRKVLAALRSSVSLPEWLAIAVRDRRVRAAPYPDDSGVVILLPFQPPDDGADLELEGPADDEGNSFIGAGGRIPLARHCEEVRRRVERFSDLLGLPTEIAAALCRAADLHDAGKADPRFQLWLYGSEAEAARDGFAPIAKSGAVWRNAAAVEAARRRAGWPKGGRHEAFSVLMVRDNQEAVTELTDAELMIHLIGTHHGRGRPLWPVVTDEDEPVLWTGQLPTVRCRLLDIELSARTDGRPESALTPLHAGWVDAYWRMVARYGWWGLAYLEALLVLADHRQSQAEKEASS